MSTEPTENLETKILIGTRLGYVKEIRYLGRLSTNEVVYSAAETLDVHKALRFFSKEDALTAAEEVWMLKKEGYAILEIALYNEGVKNGINSGTTKDQTNSTAPRS